MKATSATKLRLTILTLPLFTLMLLSACTPGSAGQPSEKPVSTSLPATPQAPVAAGQDRGNGAEDPKPLSDGGAWFLGIEKTVRYCIEVDPDFFDMSPERLARYQKFPDLLKSIHEYPIVETKLALEKWIQWVQTSGDYYYQKRILTTKFEEVSCDATVDLKFLFGQSTPEIEAAKKLKRHPMAFAAETDVNYVNGWRKGYVWISRAGSHPIVDLPSRIGPDRYFPDWTDPDQLHAILLHELGHVFGSDHVEGTIMDENIVRRIGNATYATSNFAKRSPEDRALLRQINQQRMVLFPLDIAFSIPGQLGDGYNKADRAQAVIEIFTALMNRAPSGNVEAVLKGTDPYDLRLEINDALGGHRFPIKVRQLEQDRLQIFGRGRGAYIYSEREKSDGTKQVGYMIASDNYGEVYSGTLETIDGRGGELLIQVNPLNLNLYEMGPFRIALIGPGSQVRTLFRAGLVY